MTIVLVLLALVTAGTASILHVVDNHKPNTTPPKQVAVTKHAVKAATVVQFTAQADKTVLEQLKQKANVVTKDSQYGQYVDSIDGIKGGTDGKFWGYYVDGQMANIGAGEYKTKGGENVVWKFE